jgi:beta-N-acetylhexosaminidase
VPLDRIGSVVGIPEHAAVADEVAERSITLLKNDRNLLPLRGTRSASVLAVSFRRQSDILAARTFNRVLRETYPRLSTVDVDSDADASTYANVLRRVRGQNLVIVSTYSSYAGAVDALEDLTGFIEQVRRTGVPHLVISFGNPYLISSFPDVQAYMLAWNGSEASQRAAARALIGDFTIAGRVPTSIPPLFTLGDGLRVPMKTQTAVDH